MAYLKNEFDCDLKLNKDGLKLLIVGFKFKKAKDSLITIIDSAKKITFPSHWENIINLLTNQSQEIIEINKNS